MLKFDINILWTLINLIIFFVLMKLFLFKPIKKTLDKRKELIEGQFKAAEDKEKKADELQAEYQKRSLISLRAPRTWKEFNDVAAFFTRKENPASPTEYGASFAGAIDEELAPEILIRLWACGGKLWDNYHRPTFHTNGFV